MKRSGKGSKKLAAENCSGNARMALTPVFLMTEMVSLTESIRSKVG